MSRVPPGIGLHLSFFLILVAVGALSAAVVSYDCSSSNVQWIGAWPFGPPYAVSADTSRNLCFLGSGAGVYVFDLDLLGTTWESEPLTQIGTVGVVNDLHYDGVTQRLYVAVKDVGVEIWDFSNLSALRRLSTFELWLWVRRSPRGVFVSNSYAYVAGNAGLWVFDVSDPFNPKRAGFEIDADYGYDVLVAGSYAYVKRGGWFDGGFWVVDISYPADPYVVGECSVPTGWQSGDFLLTDIDISNSYVYAVGSEDGFWVIDVSDPASPAVMCHYGADYFGEHDMPIGVSVVGDFAFVTRLSWHFLSVFDVSNPLNPSKVNELDNPTGTTPSEVFGSESYVFIIGNPSTNTMFHSLLVVDVSDPLGSLETGMCYWTPGPASSVWVHGDYAYLANWGLYGTRVIDVSDLTNPQEINRFSDGLYDVFVSGAYLYALEYTRLKIADISNPNSPVRVGTFHGIPSGAEDLFISANRAYIAGPQLLIIDVSEATDPCELGRLPKQTRKVFVSGAYAYATTPDGLSVIDVSDPTAPREVGLCAWPAAVDVFVRAPYAYVSGLSYLGEGGFCIIDISDPTNPHVASSLEEVLGRSIFVEGAYAYVSGAPGLSVIDVSDPMNPYKVGEHETPAPVTGIFVRGSCAFVACGDAGLQIYEFLGGPENEPPIANAGPDQVVTDTDGNGSEAVTLDGSGSYDPDGDIASAVWTENEVQIATGGTPTVALSVGTHTITLTVTDYDGATDTDDVVIIVTTAPALIQDFTASDGEDGQCTLHWTNPPDEGLCTVVVQRKTDKYPSDHTDGETRLVIDAATPGLEETFLDQGLTNGQYYYYTVFSCDNFGNWNELVMEGKNRDIGNPRRLRDGKESKYAFILCGDREGNFTVSAHDMRSALATWWYIPSANITLCNTRDLAAQDMYTCNCAIGDKIKAWIQNCKMDSDDMAIFYYTGHGEEGGEGIDPKCDSAGIQGYIMYDELSNLIGGHAGTTIIILDACYSGCAITGTANLPDNNLKGPDRWLLTACNGCEQAECWSLLGTEFTAFMRFTRNLIRAMSWEDPNIAGSDNLISLREAFNYADERCNAHNWAIALKPKLKGHQDPQMWPVKGDLVVQPQRGNPEAQSSLFFGLLCPVDLSVIDPMGRRLSQDNNEIGDNAFYVEADFNNDGNTEVLCKIYVPATGKYSADVTPRADASPTDTFSLLAGSENSATTLADKTEVGDIPEDPYTLDPSINTPVGDNTKVAFPDHFVTVIFDSITESGNTNVCTTEDFPSGPFPNIGFIGKLYEFTTTANYAGSVTIELLYDDNSLTSYEETALKLFKITEDGTATDITTGLDTEQNLITGVTDSFSSFAVGVVLSEVHTPAVFRVTREGDVRADGSFFGQSFETGSADVAEWVPVSEPVEPGDVLELDPDNPGQYRRSSSMCSTLVAGVVSTEPGVVLGTGGDVEGKALLALLGIVPVKVTDEGGPIQPGDLLVTSSTPGHAMRWDPGDGSPCDLVGKALEPLTDERGVILVLLMSH